MNVIETTKGELYKAVPHIPARSYEKDVYYQRTPQEIVEHIDNCYHECEAAGNKVHSYKLWAHLTNPEREHYLKHWKTDHNRIIGRETVHVTYPQTGWFVSTPKWCRIFPDEEVVKIWDERT